METNKYAAVKNIKITKLFSLEELMVSFGIMFYMTLTDKGEYANYWGRQTEDAIFGSSYSGGASVFVLTQARRLNAIQRHVSDLY
ncbi:hypothetical protein V7S43_005546 [Phytophthora oleae]|uniref:PiggyBac transposable element-derived protein domain-containing protein n=1 Tax=Phytophthora oleae TaxID=2107226 RepID=A0ABD3FS04_9STRA